MEDNTFYVINEEGRRIVCESLFTFESRTTGKNYIIYTDNSQDESGNTRVFASIYDPDAEAPRLEPIETEEEWQLVAHILDTLQQEILATTAVGEEDEVPSYDEIKGNVERALREKGL